MDPGEQKRKKPKEIRGKPEKRSNKVRGKMEMNINQNLCIYIQSKFMEFTISFSLDVWYD